MADEIKPPVAIRVTRPYASDNDFLQNEIDTLTRTTVTLIGAQSRPQGVILRFEVILATGTPLLRGEGRVVAFRQASQGTDAGLTLRFTRLDARSKALVDRAASIREARARAASFHPPRLDAEPAATPPETSPRRSPSEPARGAMATPPPLPPRVSTPPPLPVQARSNTRPPPLPSRATPLAARTDGSAPSRRPPASLRAPPSRRREELLDRLRQRAKTLSRADVEALLASRPKRRNPTPRSEPAKSTERHAEDAKTGTFRVLPQG